MRKIPKTFLIIVILFLFSLSLASSHSSYLFGISLDFDRELKENTINAAQKFMNTQKIPIIFDLNNGLIMVHFEPQQTNYVEIDPIDYSVHGFRNENLKHSQGTVKFSTKQAFEIAMKEFDKLSPSTKSELKYSNAVEVDGTYFYKWFRYNNGILILNNDFFVNVDAVNGNVIAKRLAVFGYPAQLMDKNPAITGNVAKKVAELTFNLPSVENFNPYLVINGNEMLWVSRLKGPFYPFYVGVSARDGSIAFTGVVPGEVPDNYSAGIEIKIIETDMVENIYSSK
ncbi:MAG TPA: hypothetical protein VJI97_00870 [Candidatus Nanoarchaeia archaeon]|nr:hypothetical protein [Candidatus Nanoarchaeia archaeon]